MRLLKPNINYDKLRLKIINPAYKESGEEIN